MKKLIGAAVLAAATIFAGAALANDTLEAAFGNTVTVVAPDGTLLASYYISADGTFSFTTAEGSFNGSWREDVDANQICLTVEGGEEACSDLVDGIGVGDSWTADDGNGGQNMLTIVAGT